MLTHNLNVTHQKLRYTLHDIDPSKTNECTNLGAPHITFTYAPTSVHNTLFTFTCGRYFEQAKLVCIAFATL